MSGNYETRVMRPKVVKSLAILDAHPVENVAKYGMPDVNYIGGWLELKWKQNWPVRPQTPLTLAHYTTQQRVWTQRRITLGGIVNVLLKVQGEWLLLPGKWAARHLGHANRAELMAAATMATQGFDGLALLRHLDNGPEGGVPWRSPRESDIGLNVTD